MKLVYTAPTLCLLKTVKASLISRMGADSVLIKNEGVTKYFYQILHQKDITNNPSNVTQEIIDQELPTGNNFKIQGSTMKHVFNINTPEKPQDEDNTIDMSTGDDSTVAERFFSMAFNIPVVHNYGCWCFGGSHWPGPREAGKGRGEVQDVYDENCKSHAVSYDCIKLDSKIRIQSGEASSDEAECIPVETTYALGVIPSPTGFGYTLGCINSEEDWCKRRVCQVDMSFMARVWALELQSVFPDYANFGHDGFHNGIGSFDVDLNCGSLSTTVQTTTTASVTGSGDTTPADSSVPSLPKLQVCCGDYPFRVWHDLNNQQGKECCIHNDPDITSEYGFPVGIGEEYKSSEGVCCSNGVQLGIDDSAFCV